MLHQIGVGALGPVFRTYEPSRDRLVAVKVFRLDITPEQARSLADELARAADAGLFHPSVVEPLASGLEGTVAYRAEEYVAAESLDVALRHYAPAAPDKVLPVVTQLAGALDFARAVGIGHGALHPRDVFVTPEEARATGFGVVDALERVGLRAPVRRPYTPPERIAGVAWGTPSDVFSLAVIAYELLTGRRPSGTGEQIGPLSGFAHAENVRAILARAMDDDPARRYPDALAFAGDLESAARGETGLGAARVAVAAAPPPPVPRAVALPEDVGATQKAAEAPAPTSPAAPDVDDIAGEREEDEAHWALVRDEEDHLAAVEPEQEGDATPIEQDAVEAAADRLVFDAADLALAGSREAQSFADEFDTTTPLSRPPREVPQRETVKPLEAPRVTRPAARAPEMFQDVAGRTPFMGRDDTDAGEDFRSSDFRSSSERARPVMLPVAVAAIVCLLLGYAAGYFVGSRGGETGENARAGTAAESNDAAAAAPSAREFSEGAVGAASAQPPSAPPAVPPEAPDPAETPEAKEPVAPTTGRLVVRSTPAGAAVTIDGRWRGRTPLTLDDLPLGKHMVRVVAPGYEVAREELMLANGGGSRTVNVRLRRQAAQPSPQRPAAPPAAPPSPRSFSGSVYVDSRPRGANVLINGKAVGTTPLRVPELSIGSHVVRLELPDHRIWTASVRVAAGEETRVTGSLDPIR